MPAAGRVLSPLHVTHLIRLISSDCMPHASACSTSSTAPPHPCRCCCVANVRVCCSHRRPSPSHAPEQRRRRLSVWPDGQRRTRCVGVVCETATRLITTRAALQGIKSSCTVPQSTHQHTPAHVRLSVLHTPTCTGAALGTGSAMAHRAVDAMMGPRGGGEPAAAAPAAPEAYTPAPAAQQSADERCAQQAKAFAECMSRNSGDMGACQFYFEAMQVGWPGAVCV